MAVYEEVGKLVLLITPPLGACKLQLPTPITGLLPAKTVEPAHKV